jgi:hypothetical protein
MLLNLRKYGRSANHSGLRPPEKRPRMQGSFYWIAGLMSTNLAGFKPLL